jgi:mannose-6-phosphate isomerase-like protein (cupin superfamily)
MPAITSGSAYQWTDYDKKIKAPEAKKELEGSLQEALKDNKLTSTEITDLKDKFIKAYKAEYGNAGAEDSFYQGLSAATGVGADRLKVKAVEFTFKIKALKVESITESKETIMQTASQFMSKGTDALSTNPPDFTEFNKNLESVRDSNLPGPVKAKIVDKLNALLDKKLISAENFFKTTNGDIARLEKTVGNMSFYNISDSGEKGINFDITQLKGNPRTFNFDKSDQMIQINLAKNIKVLGDPEIVDGKKQFKLSNGDIIRMDPTQKFTFVNADNKADYVNGGILNSKKGTEITFVKQEGNRNFLSVADIGGPNDKEFGFAVKKTATNKTVNIEKTNNIAEIWLDKEISVIGKPEIVDGKKQFNLSNGDIIRMDPTQKFTFVNADNKADYVDGGILNSKKGTEISFVKKEGNRNFLSVADVGGPDDKEFGVFF